MSLLRLLMERGGVPGANEAERIQSGGSMPPMRGFVPWNSGFEGTQKQMLDELLRSLEMRRGSQSGAALKRLLPMLKA
jgi:hypothetical protein